MSTGAASAVKRDMRRSASVTLVLLPMLATAAVASADPEPEPEPVPALVDPSAPPAGWDPQLAPPGMTEPMLAPPGMVPVHEQPRCDDPATWADIPSGLGLPPDDCRREYGPFTSHTGVIRGGFGVYFGTGGG